MRLLGRRQALRVFPAETRLAVYRRCLSYFGYNNFPRQDHAKNIPNDIPNGRANFKKYRGRAAQRFEMMKNISRENYDFFSKNIFHHMATQYPLDRFGAYPGTRDYFSRNLGHILNRNIHSFSIEDDEILSKFWFH